MNGNDVLEYLEMHPEDEGMDEELLNQRVYKWKYGEDEE